MVPEEQTATVLEYGGGILDRYLQLPEDSDRVAELARGVTYGVAAGTVGRGPGWSPGPEGWRASLPAGVGRPKRESSGMKAPAVDALFADSGPATPAMAPLPNFSGLREIRFSMA